MGLNKAKEFIVSIWSNISSILYKVYSSLLSFLSELPREGSVGVMCRLSLRRWKGEKGKGGGGRNCLFLQQRRRRVTQFREGEEKEGSYATINSIPLQPLREGRERRTKK